ncbi:hypothetical protein [Streptomyces filamentosus]|uniref:Uncharacterized protein n=1 Tax=Streptomyces filamentosus TaxID=67294 RepID=A0A919EH22_STRFL|nr:hypothetical protein [Streptomyces filamentosus]GHF77146.1 hypothetical protein GCM10017667_00540 [Streptomyces filamentosus]
MIRLPQVDPDGVVYRINLWSDFTGGVPVLVNVPARTDLDSQAIETEVIALANRLTEQLQVGVTNILRHESTSAELQLTQPETP